MYIALSSIKGISDCNNVLSVRKHSANVVSATFNNSCESEGSGPMLNHRKTGLKRKPQSSHLLNEEKTCEKRRFFSQVILYRRFERSLLFLFVVTANSHLLYYVYPVNARLYYVHHLAHEKPALLR